MRNDRCGRCWYWYWYIPEGHLLWLFLPCHCHMCNPQLIWSRPPPPPPTNCPSCSLWLLNSDCSLTEVRSHNYFNSWILLQHLLAQLGALILYWGFVIISCITQEEKLIWILLKISLKWKISGALVCGYPKTVSGSVTFPDNNYPIIPQQSAGETFMILSITIMRVITSLSGSGRLVHLHVEERSEEL